MNRKGLWLAAALACALAAPLQTLTAASSVPVGSTVTSLDLCPDGPGGVSYPGSVPPFGCQGDSSGTTSVTMCPGSNLHAFVRTQVMVDGKRPALQPLAGTVAVHVHNSAYGSQNNVSTSPEHGTALSELGNLPPGTYDVRASLWTGIRTASDGTATTYPASQTTVSLTVSETPCTNAPATDGGKVKKGCGVGDANHQHDPKSGKTCPTK
jgi:hypothetical protein